MCTAIIGFAHGRGNVFLYLMFLCTMCSLLPQCRCSSVPSMYPCPLGMFLCTINVPLSPWDVPLYPQCTSVPLGCSSVPSMYPFSLGMFLCTLNVPLSPWGVPSMYYPSQFLCDLVFLRTLWGAPVMLTQCDVK